MSYFLLCDVELLVLQLAGDDAAERQDRGLVQLGGGAIVAGSLLHPSTQQLLVAHLRHVGRQGGVDGGGLLGKHGGHLQDLGVAPTDAGEQLGVCEEYLRVFGLGLLQLSVELAQLQVSVLVHSLGMTKHSKMQSLLF